jgi:hypothetical protein
MTKTMRNKMNKCPIGNHKCIVCLEYSKECLCDFPYRNCDKEIKSIQLWGHRMPLVKYPEKAFGRN